MKPILFNTKMVKAILDGRKTQTRRICKEAGDYALPDLSFYDPERRTYAVHNYQAKGYGYLDKISTAEQTMPICPGDVLYVRETWAINRITPNDPKWLYRADYDMSLNPYDKWKWRSSIHMPKEAARIFLLVTNVRLERLQYMTEDDAKAEGASCCTAFEEKMRDSSFAEIWDSTIKKSDIDTYGWNANPWVWVYEFERVEGGNE